MNVDLSAVWALVVTYGVRVVGVLILLIVALIVARWVRNIVRRGMERANIDPALTGFASSLARWSVLVAALIACLGVFGVQTTSFAALIGAAGLAVGLAFQGTLSNFSAGVMLLIFRPFTIGQFIKVSGEAGTVQEIALFTTTLDTPDNRRIILPNSSVFGATLENVSYHETRRCDVSVGVDYSADIDRTREVLMSAIETIEERLADPAPAAYLIELGDSSVNWAVRVWIHSGDYWSVREKLTRAVKMKLDAAGIGIPYPQLDVHLDKVS